WSRKTNPNRHDILNPLLVALIHSNAHCPSTYFGCSRRRAGANDSGVTRASLPPPTSPSIPHHRRLEPCGRRSVEARRVRRRNTAGGQIPGRRVLEPAQSLSRREIAQGLAS